MELYVAYNGLWRRGSSTLPYATDFVLGQTKPSDTNSGIRVPKSSLTVHNGTHTPVANTTYERLLIKGRASVNVANVTYIDCFFEGSTTNVDTCINATGANVSNLNIIHCTLKPATPSESTNGINGHDFTLYRCLIEDSVDCIGLFNTHAPGQPINVTIQGSMLHKMAYFSPCSYQPSDNQTHNDAIQIQGGTGAIITGNTINAFYGAAGSHQPQNFGTSPSGWPNPSLACILFNNNVGNTGLHNITENWFEGGYLPINCGGAPGVDLGTFHRNRFDGLSGLNQNPKSTIQKLNSQTLDAGVGTANQNVFYNGDPILVRSSN